MAQVVSPLAFTFSFVGGLIVWFGYGVVAVARNRLRCLTRGDWQSAGRARSCREFVPPGYAAFILVALGFGLLAGLVAGLVPQSRSFSFACAAHISAAAAYGTGLRALAHHGYLPFAEPS